MNMSFRFKMFSYAMGLASCVALTGSVAFAQDQDDSLKIEVVVQDKDGKKLVIPRPLNPPQSAMRIETKDGKIIVIDADGNRKEIDLKGAKSVTLNHLVETTDQNGVQDKKFFGKAIIIGPDGKRQEIVLGNPTEGESGFSGWRGIFQADRVDNKFMIGVYCEKVGDALRTQLDLETGSGLVVVTVNDDSAAAKAGLRKHDILMTADDTQLSEQSDLVKTIQAAGKEKSAISLTVIRGGKEIGVEVSPVERTEHTFENIEGLPEMLHVLPDMNGRNFNFKFKNIEPGIIFGDDFDREISDEMQANLEKQMEEMRAQMEEVRKQMKQIKEKKDR